MADDLRKTLYKTVGKFPAVSKSEIDTKSYAKADTSEFLARRKMLGASSKDIASALIKSSPIGRGARAIKGALKTLRLNQKLRRSQRSPLHPLALHQDRLDRIRQTQIPSRQMRRQQLRPERSHLVVVLVHSRPSRKSRRVS